MKKLILLLLIIVPLFALGQKNEFLKDIKVTDEMKTVAIGEKDSLVDLGDLCGKIRDLIAIHQEEKEEYETIVFAPGFESFVTTQPTKSYFTESWLKSKNILMVTEWNYRNNNPSRYNPSIYEEAIDYDNRTDYGLDVEYTLYMFFRFMEKENNMSLIGDRQIVGR